MSKYRNVTVVLDDEAGHLWDRLNGSAHVEVEHVGDSTRIDKVSRFDVFPDTGNVRIYTHADAENPIRTRTDRIQWWEGTYESQYGDQ